MSEKNNNICDDCFLEIPATSLKGFYTQLTWAPPWNWNWEGIYSQSLKTMISKPNGLNINKNLNATMEPSNYGKCNNLDPRIDNFVKTAELFAGLWNFFEKMLTVWW